MIADALAVIVIVSSCVQVGYSGYFFSRIFCYPKRSRNEGFQADDLQDVLKPPVSVIICAKNEAHNLRRFLPLVLTQEYYDHLQLPMFEVVVVNDQSGDDTVLVLAELQQSFSHLKVVNIPPDERRALPGKKFALRKGLAAAAYGHILMTDADCRPAGKSWIASIAEQFIAGTAIVAGYGGYDRQGGVLNLFIRCETIHTYLQYLTYTLAGHPYMAVGRNLGARKELLLYAQAHDLWKSVPSGDDDLLVRLCAAKNNMTVLASPEAATWSEAKSTWGEWIKQKQRHLSTGKLYNGSIKMLLGGYALSHAAFWVSSIAALLLIPVTSPIYLFALLRCILFWGACFYCSAITTDRRLSFFWPLFDIGWLLYNSIFAPFIFWKNKQQWK